MFPERELCFFRQLLIIYEFIFYRLDRPMLPAKMWPLFFNILKENLKKALEQKEILREWLEDLWPGKNEYSQNQKRKYEICRFPLSLTAQLEIQTILQKLLAIEIKTQSIKSKTKKGELIKSEISEIRQYAFQKAWQIASLIGWEKI